MNSDKIIRIVMAIIFLAVLIPTPIYYFNEGNFFEGLFFAAIIFWGFFKILPISLNQPDNEKEEAEAEKKENGGEPFFKEYLEQTKESKESENQDFYKGYISGMENKEEEVNRLVAGLIYFGKLAEDDDYKFTNSELLEIYSEGDEIYKYWPAEIPFITLKKADNNFFRIFVSCVDEKDAFSVGYINGNEKIEKLLSEGKKATGKLYGGEYKEVEYDDEKMKEVIKKKKKPLSIFITIQ